MSHSEHLLDITVRIYNLPLEVTKKKNYKYFTKRQELR